MKLAHHRNTPPHIPFIALADIAWQIIIFFLLTATFASSIAMNVELPGGTDQPQGKPGEPITVHAGQNLLLVNNHEVALGELEGHIRKLLTGRGESDLIAAAKAQERVANAVAGKAPESRVKELQAAVTAAMNRAQEARAVIVEGREDLTFQRDVDVMYSIQKAGGTPVMSEEK